MTEILPILAPLGLVATVSAAVPLVLTPVGLALGLLARRRRAH